MRQFFLLCAAVVLPTILAANEPSAPVRVTFLTDCTTYSNWMSIGMIFSFKMSGQPGKLTKVMCCTEAEKAAYNNVLLNAVETHIAPSLTINPHNHDNYAAYNKPEAVIDYLEHVTPEEEYVLVLDSDMILRRPFFVEVMGPRKGLAVGARYTYMIGVNNELADRHIPQVAKRNDTLAGPYGRRADQVGGFFFIHRDDLKAMSHDWLKFSEDVRGDDQAYRLSGDVYAVSPGDKPWISEMYGYAFGAAKADVWHKWDVFSMIYPGYEPHDGIPKLMHYGLLFEIGNYSFDKHWHYDFDVTKCPPWDFTDPRRRTAGIFLPPPSPKDLKSKGQFLPYYKDLLATETVATLNAGFCDYHLQHCPPSEQLLSTCREAIRLYNEVTEAVKDAEANYDCQDFHPKCTDWAAAGECQKNVDYMTEQCRKACKLCDDSKAYVPKTNTKWLEDIMDKMGDQLKELAKDPDQSKGISASPVAQAVKPVIIPKNEVSPVVVQAVQQAQAPAVVVEVPAASPPPPVVAPPPPKSIKTKKQLMVRCYRMSLPLPEVKACVQAAKNGEEYAVKDVSPPAEVVLSSKSEEDQASRVVGRDLEDLSLSQKKNEAVSPSIDAVPSNKSALGVLSKLTTWQALGLWLLVVAAFLTVVPKIFKMRRRARSGMRTE